VPGRLLPVTGRAPGRVEHGSVAIRIGISGWRYAPWRGVFYPPALPQRRELEYAALLFPSIEINGSFYSLQSPGSWQCWHDATPGHFVFSVKGPRFVTHILRLRECETALANFFASGVLLLRGKLGPFLWQFPPNFRYERERFADFFRLLPRTMGEAVALATRHDVDRMRGRHAWPDDFDLAAPLWHSIEIRHPTFETPDFIALLREHDIGLVVADTAGKWPLMFDVTSDFVYVRLHGDEELYVSGYSEAALDAWAGKFRTWADAGLDVYAYLDNDVKVHAPFDAHALMRKLGAHVPMHMPDVRTVRMQLPFEARSDAPAGLRRG
jgi:uncharacterized protein YecE (DUF72 family)